MRLRFLDLEAGIREFRHRTLAVGIYLFSELGAEQPLPAWGNGVAAGNHGARPHGQAVGATDYQSSLDEFRIPVNRLGNRFRYGRTS